MDGNALTKRVLLQGSEKDRMVVALGVGEVETCGQRQSPCGQLAWRQGSWVGEG